MKSSKIFFPDQAIQKASALQSSGRRIVLCYGHFNIIHPGHLRFLNFAKKQGDLLVVAIESQNNLDEINIDDFYTEDERAEGVASLEVVDVVCIVPNGIIEFIDLLRPNIYIKGREFENNTQVIENEIKAVERHGGRVVFSAGEINYSRLQIEGSHNIEEQAYSRKREFKKICKRENISLERLMNLPQYLKSLRMLVIGDTIVDQFVSCDTLGVSSEAPVLAIREIESKEFIGGAAIVAQHVRSLGAECTFVSVLGADQTSDFVRDSLEKSGIDAFLVTDDSRPTTFKIRYMVDNQKLLRVSRLRQHDISVEIENKLLNYFEQINDYDGIILSDFVYGVLTNRVLERVLAIAKNKNIKVFGDVQCSSQLGDVTKFKNIELITPTEKEARIGLADQTSGLESLAQKLLKVTKNNNVVITLGGQGLLAYSRKKNKDGVHSEYFPALEENPLDVAGAGDSVLTGYALGLCYGLTLMEASAFAICLAGISVSRIGNVPITPPEVKNYIQGMIDFSANGRRAVPAPSSYRQEIIGQ